MIFLRVHGPKSSPVIEGQGHRSKPKVRGRVSDNVVGLTSILNRGKFFIVQTSIFRSYHFEIS